MSGWKGLSAELAQVEHSEPTATVAPAVTVAAGTAPALAPTAAPRPTGGGVAPDTATQPRRRRRGADSFVSRHRLVGIYFPHDIDETFRIAAEYAEVSNSEYVVEAVRQRLRNEGRL